MVSVTRTLNPLPFEHMEPKRFEDLVRQLAYDFRSWQTLEATGRSGSDQGFDALGIELCAVSESPLSDGDDEASDESSAPSARTWLIQCKREKSISPAKMRAMLADIPPASTEGLYGLIFAAACDFSKATRDECREWCRLRGVQEVHIWGRGEIEDQLFHPKNDHLLFAFFGISLQIRRRSAGTAIRRNIALKRRIRKFQEHAHWPGAPIIIRDPADERYPRAERKDWEKLQLPWRPYWSLGVGVRGLRVILRLHKAYYDDATGAWDFATKFNQAYPQMAKQLWPRPNRYGGSEETVEAWLAMPRKFQHHFMIVGTLPYEEIIEIDPEPDGFADIPTVFTTFRPWKDGAIEPPFLERVEVEMSASLGSPFAWVEDNHVRAFPEQMRDSGWESAWSTRNGWQLGTEHIDLPVDPEVETTRQTSNRLGDTG